MYVCGGASAGAFEGAAKSRSSVSSSSLCPSSGAISSVVVVVKSNWVLILDRRSSSRSGSGDERGDDVGDCSSSRRTLGQVSMQLLMALTSQNYRFALGNSNMASSVFAVLSRRGFGVWKFCWSRIGCRAGDRHLLGLAVDWPHSAPSIAASWCDSRAPHL